MLAFRIIVVGLIAARMILHDKYYYGRNPTDSIIPNYRNLHKQDTDYVGGFSTFLGATRERVDGDDLPEQIGGNYKDAITEPGPGRCMHICRAKQFLKKKIMYVK